MALLKVRWTVTEVHEAEVEIDGFDDDYGLDDDVMAEHEDDKSFTATIEREILEYKVVRPGDEPLSEAAAKIKAPQHDDDGWD